MTRSDDTDGSSAVGGWKMALLSQVDHVVGYNFLNQAQEVSGLAFRYIDLKSRHILVSDNSEEVLGFKPVVSLEEYLRYIHPDDRAHFIDGRTRHRESVGRYTLVYRVIPTSGEVRWIETRSETLPDENGRPAHIWLTSRDISFYRNAEIDPTVTADRLDRVQAAAGIGAWEWDVRTNQASWSRAAWNLLEPGGTGQVTLERWLAAVHPDDRELALEKSKAGADTGDFQFEYRVVRPDGRIVWLQSMGSTMRDEHGAPALIRGVVWDVTERRQARQDLLEADRRKDEFLATLAHELRNPLAPLQTVADLMRQIEVDDARITTVRSIVEQQTAHLTRLVDDLVDVSRLANGKLDLRKAPVGLAETITEAVSMCRADTDARRHQVTVSLPVEPIVLDADQFRLKQVLANLIGNASKYTPDGGIVRVSAAVEDDRVCIAVEDNGIGIAADFLPMVFDAFAQAPDQKQRAAGGLGLGLMLVRQIVELHGGTVSASSPGVGLGSRFEVRAATRLPAPVDESVQSATLKAVGIKVLVVDDYAAIRDSMELMLSMRGLAVATAGSGPAALARMATFRPDAVVLDIRMPGMSGFEVAKVIRSMPGGDQLKLVAMTGNGTEEDVRQAHEAGFDAHVIKPVRAETLIDLLTSPAAQRQAVA